MSRVRVYVVSSIASGIRKTHPRPLRGGDLTNPPNQDPPLLGGVPPLSGGGVGCPKTGRIASAT